MWKSVHKVCSQTLNLGSIYDETNHPAAISNTLIASELGRANTFEQFCQGLLVLALCECSCSPAALLLTLHSLFKARDIYDEAVLGGYLLRQLQGETVCIIELKGIFTRNNMLAVLLHILDKIVEQVEASVQGRVKLLLL